MNPMDVAYRAFPGRFTVKNNEIIPQYCPFCNGGDHHDKGTFALNIDTGLYNCKRSNCGEQGTLKQLCEKMNVPWDNERLYEPRNKTRKEKVYKKPQSKLEPLTEEQKQYLAMRRLKPETCELLKIGNVKGKLAFPYYEKGQLVAMKFRGKQADGKWKQFSMEPSGKLVFWGMDLCSPDMPVCICEGEIDTAVLWQAGIQAVSLPNGCQSLECVELCWDWLKKFPSYYIWTDNDDGGIKAREELVKRLGPAKCQIIAHPTLKDANEVLFKEGLDGVVKCITQAEAIPIVGLKNLAELPEYDPAQDTLVPTGIYEVDDAIDGGLRMGEVSIWTGYNSSGKSTLLGQILLNAIDQGQVICAYSGELPDRIFRYWLELQAAGPQYIKQEANKRGKQVNKPDFKMIKHIRDWYSGKFWLYSSDEVVTQDAILEVFEYAYRRYNCRIFAADNLMSIALGAKSDSDFYRKQADFIGFCKDFAKKYDVHIHIVAHPRKPQGGRDGGDLDVAGSGNITNWADNVFEMKRFTQKEKDGIESDPKYKGKNITNSLKIKKNRFLGRQDRLFSLSFDEASKRYFIPGNFPDWKYSWVKSIGEKSTEDKLKEWSELGRMIDLNDD